MQEITRPTLLLDEQKVRRNIRNMAEKARRNNLVLRPHFKTHVSAEIGEWFREEGVSCCTVASVEMAEYFFRHNWRDITIAFPVNILEIATINRLASECSLNLTAEDPDSLDYLEQHLEHTVNYFIKLDVGTHRTGLPPETDFAPLMRKSEKLRFRGFLVHAGHSYRSRSNQEIKTVYREVAGMMANLKKRYPESFISYGDTPTCSVIRDFEHIDELRAGNFVFYDWMQKLITSCTEEEIGVCMVVPVVARHRDRMEVVVHGGAVHFSKEGVEDEKGRTIYGKYVRLTPRGWEFTTLDIYVKKLSQEHGVLSVEDEAEFSRLKPGQLVGIVPVHSCLTADLMAAYVTTEGKRIFHMKWCRE